MIRCRSVRIVALLMVSWTLLPVRSAAALACNTEQVKFLETQRSTWGAMVTVFVFDREVAWCGSVANTVYWSMGSTGLDFLETGTRQFGGLPGRFALFYQYRTYPAPLQYDDTWHMNNETYENLTYMSFSTTNVSGTSYQLKAQYSFGASQTEWYTLAVTPYMSYNYGIPLTEISRYGNSDASTSFSGLKYRPVTGGWLPFDSLVCSRAALNTVPDWDAHKVSNTAWNTSYAPVAGQC